MKVLIRNLTVTFPGTAIRNAVQRLTLSTQHGEFLTILGPSGCGKTTLLRVIAGMLPATSGSVELVAGPKDPSERVLMVVQEDGLFPWMNGMTNAAFGLAMRGVSRDERETRAFDLLRQFGLGGRERDWPHQLSAGMKQRVNVIRAFLGDPALLLMDEPFAALDVQNRLSLQRELLVLCGLTDKSVLFVTHDVDEALLLSDRVVVMTQQGCAMAAAT